MASVRNELQISRKPQKCQTSLFLRPYYPGSCSSPSCSPSEAASTNPAEAFWPLVSKIFSLGSVPKVPDHRWECGRRTTPLQDPELLLSLFSFISEGHNSVPQGWGASVGPRQLVPLTLSHLLEGRPTWPPRGGSGAARWELLQMYRTLVPNLDSESTDHTRVTLILLRLKISSFKNTLPKTEDWRAEQRKWQKRPDH